MKEMQQSVGALWETRSRNGLSFMTGNVEVNGHRMKIVAFKNANKKTDKHPDWRIFISKPKPKETGDFGQEEIIPF